MYVGKTLRVTERKRWRAWLQKHHDSEPDIWLLFPKKASGEPGISYNDAVEEALCFGWIDSIVKPFDSVFSGTAVLAASQGLKALGDEQGASAAAA